MCLALASPGCHSNTELIENELRIKDRQLEELRGELQKKECDVRTLEYELERLQRKPKPGEPTPSPVLVESLTLGRLTGGVDEDPHCPGDEAIQVLVEPRDCDRQTVKAPGSLRVDAFEISPQGMKTHLSTWELNARELRRTWENPVFGGPAYRVVLRFTKWPSTDKLRLVVRFVTPEGVNFEAERDVTIRLPERPKRPSPPPEPPEAPPREAELRTAPFVVPALAGAFPPQGGTMSSGVAPAGHRTRPITIGIPQTKKPLLLPPIPVRD